MKKKEKIGKLKKKKVILKKKEKKQKSQKKKQKEKNSINYYCNLYYFVSGETVILRYHLKYVVM